MKQLIGNFVAEEGGQESKVHHVVQPHPKYFGCVEMCRICGLEKKTLSSHGIQTVYRCKQCSFSLFYVSCFLTYHQQKNAEIQDMYVSNIL
jgi:hypothetical protein